MKSILTALLVSLSIFIQAQNLSIGAKGGVNYNFSGDLIQLNVLENAADNIYHNPDSNTGYHGGLWTKLNVGDLFIKTELYYTQYKNSFTNNPNLYLLTNRLDLPVLLGFEFIGPLFINGGVDFQYIIREKFSIETTTIEYNDISRSFHLGAGLEFRRIAAEVRWEKGITENDLSLIGTDFGNFSLNNSPNQILISLQLDLSGNNK